MVWTNPCSRGQGDSATLPLGPRNSVASIKGCVMMDQLSKAMAETSLLSLRMLPCQSFVVMASILQSPLAGSTAPL